MPTCKFIAGDISRENLIFGSVGNSAGLEGDQTENGTPNMHTELRKVYTYADVAEMLHCNVRTVERLADAGRMPQPIKLNRLVRWPVAQIDDWIAQGCPEPSAVDAVEVTR